MKKLSLVVAAGAALAWGGIAAAQGMQGQPGMGMQGMHGNMGMVAKDMDANADGKISQDEFMRFHQAMFEQMKGRDGHIAVDAMQAMHPGCPMMQGDGKAAGDHGGMMQHHGGMMQHHGGMMGGGARR